MMAGLQTGLVEASKDTKSSAKETLYNVLMLVMDSCEKNKKLFGVVLDYLLQIKKSGADPAEKVQRRVIHLRHLLSTIIIRGINSGEFKKVSVKEINELFYSIIESAIFKLAVLNQDSLAETRQILKLTIENLAAN